MSSTNNSDTASQLPARRSRAPWQPTARRWVLLVGLVLVTVLLTQFFTTSPARAARAAALVVWAQDDPARLQAVQRYAACMRDGAAGYTRRGAALVTPAAPPWAMPWSM